MTTSGCQIESPHQFDYSVSILSSQHHDQIKEGNISIHIYLTRLFLILAIGIFGKVAVLVRRIDGAFGSSSTELWGDPMA